MYSLLLRELLTFIINSLQSMICLFHKLFVNLFYNFSERPSIFSLDNYLSVMSFFCYSVFKELPLSYLFRDPSKLNRTGVRLAFLPCSLYTFHNVSLLL